MNIRTQHTGINNWRGVLLAASLAGGLLQSGLSAVVELGRLPLHAQTNLSLVITNPFLQAVSITNVVASCECVTVRRLPDPLAAGAAGQLEVVLDAREAGLFGYALTLQTAPPMENDWQCILNVAVEGEKRDARLYKTAAQVLSAQQAGAVFMFVDVRRPDEFEKARIPESLQIPLYAVKTKDFLKTRDVVLVDQGWGDAVLEAECRKLQESGFQSVAILEGGLNAWRRGGGGLEGFADASLACVSPPALPRALGLPDWLVVAAGVTTAPPSCLAIPYASGQEQAVAAAVAGALARQPAGSILLVTDKGEYPAALLQAVEGINVPVYCLEGGWAGWEMQQVINRPGRQILVQTAAANGQAPARRGCGGCAK